MTTISRENYLKRVFLLQQEHRQAVPMGALATSLGVASASVTGMVKSLVDRGLVRYEPYVGVSLTDEGQRLALDVIRRHRLIELFLVKTLGIDWSQVHDEAELLEHAISDRLLDRIDAYLDHPSADPHGDPIPEANGKVRMTRFKSLSEFQSPQKLRVVRIMDQDAKFLRYVDRIGLRPGACMQILGNDPDAQVLRVQTETGQEVTLAAATAAKLWVEPA